MPEPAVQRIEGVQQIAFRAMGSQMLAGVRSDDPQALSLLAQVPGWFEEWEQTLSRFRESSELSNLNRLSDGRTPIKVSDTLWEVLQLALSAAHATDGLITPTVLSAVEAAGYTTSFEDMKDRKGEAAEDDNSRAADARASHGTKTLAAWREIRINPDTHEVILPAGARLDFGGIAKGWAADQAANRLAQFGPAIMDAGGDIATAAPEGDDYEWYVGIDAPTFPPFEPGTQLELLALRSAGVATSGRDYRRWQKDGEWRHHIIDPRTGSPADTDIVAATIVAPTAREAEIAAKVVLVMGSREGLAWLEARPGLAGLVVLESGQVLQSARLRSHLWSFRNGVPGAEAGKF